MNEEQVYEKLTEIFQDVFDDEDIELTPGTDASDIEDWDSLAQINLIVAIEQEFDTKFSIEEATALKNVGEMVALIQAK